MACHQLLATRSFAVLATCLSSLPPHSPAPPPTPSIPCSLVYLVDEATKPKQQAAQQQAAAN